MYLHSLINPPGSRKRPKQVGRGTGSGHGKTSTRGEKGLKARSGGRTARGFEGGQMPLYRRLPKRGFSNKRFQEQMSILNLRDLEKFDEGDTITPEKLIESGVIKRRGGVKILGKGELTKKLVVHAHACSKGAREAIEKAGGKFELIG